MDPAGRWYTGVGRYQWLVLVIASLGWVFDVFEGQIFVASVNEAMPDLLGQHVPVADRPFYTNITFAAFLLGGAAGGVLFGRLSDRIGRTRTMVYTILMYSVCTCVSALSRTWWELALFRFLVALGVGGEWAVATALVAEVFPSRARARSLAIFHASSVLGTLLAVACGAFIVANRELGWRAAFVIGAVPALLVVWIRLSLRDPERPPPGERATQMGLADLFRGSLLRRTLVGVGLATVGLATFWGTHIYGKDHLRKLVERDIREGIGGSSVQAGRPATDSGDLFKRWEMIGMLLVTVGGGLGLVSFGPLAEKLGRRGAFGFFHAGGLGAALALFLFLDNVAIVCLFLPVFGFLTLGMHAGYAVYFPELFPTALRSTGAGFCFNVGRVLAAPCLFLAGWLQRQDTWGLSLEEAAALLCLLYLAGILLLVAAPETRGRELPE
jgi:MFS family permease